MKFSRSIILFSILFITLALAGCSPQQNSTQRQIGAINAIRTKLALPDLPLKFVGITDMANSPSGGLKVAQFQDTQDRNYFVEPATNQVVEIDARAGLTGISPNASAMSETDITAQAHQFIAAAIPGFETLQSNWTYEPGNKGDYYFFSWYGASTAGASAADDMNRPFAQIGIHKSGYLFAYYNTLLLEK